MCFIRLATGLVDMGGDSCSEGPGVEILPMNGRFEPRTYGVISHRSTDLATTTAQFQVFELWLSYAKTLFSRWNEQKRWVLLSQRVVLLIPKTISRQNCVKELSYSSKHHLSTATVFLVTTTVTSQNSRGGTQRRYRILVLIFCLSISQCYKKNGYLPGQTTIDATITQVVNNNKVWKG